jgi:ABC-type nitrate/sulfonate/bicarbonate transport system substrate-binding protein
MLSTKLSRREWLTGGCSLALASSVLWRQARAVAPKSVKIANAAGALNLVMAELMRQQRFLESLGLAPEVLAVADGTRILGGLVSGSIDVSTMSGFGQVFPAIARGAPIKILAGGTLLPSLALFSAAPNVRTLKDLEGKSIGTGSIGALVHQLTVTLLQKYGVDTTKMQFANIGSSADILRAVSAGTVAGGAVDVTAMGAGADHPIHLIEHGNMSIELPEYTYQGAWTLARNIETERDTLVRTLAAYAKLYRFVQNPQSKDAFIRARHAVFPKASASEDEAQWTYIQNNRPFAVDLVLNTERLRYIQALNVKFNIQKEILPFERVADMSLAREALGLLSRNP